MTPGSEGNEPTKVTRRRRSPAAAGDQSHSVRKRRAGVEDIEIGRKIRALRLERGLSQSGLADGIDLTFQQVQKYEKGTNRVSAGRLQRIAEMLNVPVIFFYGGMGTQPKKDQRNNGLAFIQTKGAMRLLRAYSEIGSRTSKYALVVLAESLRNKQPG
jgi:transcriptional regulator with XRE-family HTH domain